MTTKNQPQSSPLPVGSVEVMPLTEDGRYVIRDQNGNRIASTGTDPRLAALIVKRVNQGPAFDAMYSALVAVVNCPDYWGIKTKEMREAAAALKLAQEVR